MQLVFCISAMAQAPAFPGAEGFARYTTTGGRGGAVYHVTSLDDNASNPANGTLRYGIQKKSGKRIIVFDISGTIYLKGELKIKNGDLTIAGQSAPGDGICIADYPVVISGNNIILRYLRFRLGNRHVDAHEGDGLGGMDKKNIIVDHCSVSWSVDECLSVYGMVNHSVQWCFVTHSMVNSGHSKGSHGYGGNWGGSGASYHHNLIAHHTSRTPRLGPRPSTQCDERMDMRNNVIYNWGKNGCYGGEGMNVNIVSNYYKPGPATKKASVGYQQRIACIGIRTSSYTGHGTSSPNDWDKMWHVWGKFYVDGNVNPDQPQVTADNWTYGIYNQIKNDSGNDYTYTQATKDTMKITEPIAHGEITTHTAEMAYEKVLAYAGCSKSRDSYDNVIASDVRNGKATYTGSGLDPGFVNSQDDCGGWPALTGTQNKIDTDKDGIPDDWEIVNGLDPSTPGDATKSTLDPKGYYTNIEVYLNWLVEEITKAQNADAIDTLDEYYPIVVNPWIKADANLDGTVDVADITAVASYILGTTPSRWSLYNADVNGDGNIDVADITAAATIILEKTE